jgi:hypothetical protein
VPDNALQSSDVVADAELARRLAVGIVPIRLSGMAKGPRDTAMTELP